MPAGKLYYQALKQLPEEYVDEETRATVWDKNTVIVANPKFPPIIFTTKSQKWSNIEYGNSHEEK